MGPGVVSKVINPCLIPADCTSKEYNQILVRDIGHGMTVPGRRRTSDTGLLRLADVADLKAYCYTVAGIVGEMLTELFLLDRPALEPVADTLRERAGRFGEALQLVNILKDAGFDASEGRLYLPEHVDRGEVFALAREDLGVAAEYILTLHGNGGPRGVVAFCALPVRLATTDHAIRPRAAARRRFPSPQRVDRWWAPRPCRPGPGPG